MAPVLAYAGACCVLAWHLWAQGVVAPGPPAHGGRHWRSAARRGHAVDDATYRIAQDIAMKVTNISSVTQLYNLMARYNKDYCDKTIIRELEKFPVEPALHSMKSYCQQVTRRHMVRSLQRRAVRRSGKTNKETNEINTLLQRNSFSNKTICKPTNTIVAFPSSPESVFLPRCTNVKRCSGCCKKPTHVCQPDVDKIKIVKRKVVEIKVHVKDHKPEPRLKVMTIEEHTKCECKCAITANDCSPYQAYDDQNCSCNCRNIHERKHCSHPRTWNSVRCKCECQILTNCSVGHYRDPETCKCARISSIKNLTVPKPRKRHIKHETAR